MELWAKDVNNKDSLIRKIHAAKEKNDNIVKLLCLEELNISWLKEKDVEKINQICDNLQIKFVITTATDLPLYWAYKTFYENLLIYKQKPTGHNKHISKLFTTLNGKAWGHRCEFLDCLAKHNLLENNYYSYNAWQQKYFPVTYKFKHFDGKVKTLDDIDHTGYFSVPEEWKDSLFSVVSETSIKKIFFTEKLWHPMYHKRPVLVYAAPGYYQKLTQLGFKKHDIIDYSFDLETNVAKRLEMFVQEIKKLQKYTSNLAAIKKHLDPVVQHNFYNIKKLLETTDINFGYQRSKYERELNINTLQKFKVL
jgi:hypothetical protein